MTFHSQIIRLHAHSSCSHCTETAYCTGLYKFAPFQDVASHFYHQFVDVGELSIFFLWKLIIQFSLPLHHRLIRSGKTSKIIESNIWTNTTISTNHSTECHVQFYWNPSSDGDCTTFLSSPFQHSTSLSVTKFFLMSNLNIPWHSLRSQG